MAGGILGVINEYLEDRGLSLRQGTIVDATLIHAPSSTKNKDDKRDPEMHQTNKAIRKIVHPFRLIKRQFGYAKVRSRGLAQKHRADADAVRFVEPVDGTPTFIGVRRRGARLMQEMAAAKYLAAVDGPGKQRMLIRFQGASFFEVLAARYFRPPLGEKSYNVLGSAQLL